MDNEKLDIDTGQTVNEQSNKTQFQFNKKKFIKFLVIVVVIAILYGLYTVGRKAYIHDHTTMKTSHIYVCDNPVHDSDFDGWLRENAITMGEDEKSAFWVPTYLVIKDGVMISKFRGDIDLPQYKTYFSLSLTYDLSSEGNRLPNYEISNLDGERSNIQSLFGNGTYVLEIHWIDCPDCQHQDDNYTQSIYDWGHTDYIYRYYIKSDLDKVQVKYAS